MNEYYVLNCKAPYAFVIVADSYSSCTAHTQNKTLLIETYHRCISHRYPDKTYP